MVVNCAHYQLAILRAYFYRQRRGIRGTEGARAYVGCERRLHPDGDQSMRGPCWRLTYAAMIKATTMASTATSRA